MHDGERFYPDGHCNVSLTNCIKYHFPQIASPHDQKDEIKQCMSENPLFWETWPLTDKMIAYAADDVKYLP